MDAPSNSVGYEVLCLQAADNGRGKVLFGDSLPRARSLVSPFVETEDFPSVYLEFPLVGEPSLDVTVLYGPKNPDAPIDSPAAAGTEELRAWFVDACSGYDSVSWGYELDTSKEPLPAAAIHFQPRQHTELVEPFFAAIGEPERAALYLDLAKRMPKGWALSFFGLFRGRPNSPLRVCGYLSSRAIQHCLQIPDRLQKVFERVGFHAYDDAMIEQVIAVMDAAPSTLDFQFDVWPDGSIGDTFALDIQFGIEQPEAVRKAFTTGESSRIMPLLESWGIVDKRWRLGVDATFALGVNVTPRDGKDDGMDRYSFTLMPQWAKVRWKNGVLQPSKLYLLGKAGYMD